MEIKRVSIIGLGALGILFGHYLSQNMPKGDLKIVADKGRIERYRRDKIYCNGQRCDFDYITPEEKGARADLLLFAVKYNNLAEAIRDVRNQVGDKTVILSLLNGITSEKDIAKAYGREKVLDCVAQGMDAVKEGNRMHYTSMGKISFGQVEDRGTKDNMERVCAFFDKTGLPYEKVGDMGKRMWGKLMVNVGVNQAVAVCGQAYGDIQKEGDARDTMIAAMREVIALSEKEKVFLGEEDLDYWLEILKNLNPEGKPSMRQDVEAKRPSEVELFAGTVIALGEKHGVSTPVNRWLYKQVLDTESKY
jgi:2-dehydropantoate 2-reductase